MKIEETMCYSRLVFMMCQGEDWELAVRSVTYSQPMFSHEGIAGYVETRAVFQVADLEKFSELWHKWFKIDMSERSRFYRLVNKGSCK